MYKYLRKYIPSFIISISFIFIYLTLTCSANTLDNWQDAKSYKPKPVLLLHGFAKGNPNDWNPARSTLGNYFSKYQPLGSYLETIAFQDPNGSVDTYDPGKTNPQGDSKGWSDKVQDKINELLTSSKYGFYTNKLNFVCHSMGGLAARWYLANYSSNYVDKLILIGVPNIGSPLAKEANALSKIPKLGWLTLIPVNSVMSFIRDNIDLYTNALNIDINGEAVDDLDDSPEGSGFLNKLNNIRQSQNINYFAIVGIGGGLPNWILFKDWYGGDSVVGKASQLGTGVISLKDSTVIPAVHWREPEIAAKETDNKILQFLDSTPPAFEITYPGPGTTEIYESSVHIQGKVYKEYLPADSQLIINVERQEGGYTPPSQISLLKPSDLWIPNNPDSPVAEFDEEVAFPGQGTYQVSLQAKNPAGETSDIKEVLVKVLVYGSANIIVHCHNPEEKEIASIQGMGQNSVEIYDGDTLIGYGAYNIATHNQPILISTGNHTIKVKFNGITMEQNININNGETQALTFTFNRISRDYGEIYDYSKTESIEYPTVEGIASPKYNMSSCSSGWNCNWPGCDLYSWNLDYGEELSIVHWSMSGGIEVKWERIGNHLTVMLKGHAWVTWEVPMDIMLALGVFNYHQPQFAGGYFNKSISPYYGFDEFFVQLSNPSTNYYGLNRFDASATTMFITYPRGQGGVEDNEDLYNQNSRSFEELTDLIRDEYASWTQAIVSSIPYDLLGTAVGPRGQIRD